AYDDVIKTIGKLRSSLQSWLDLDWIDQRKFNAINGVLNDFTAKIHDKNVSYLEWVHTSKSFRGKGLSYPLICQTLRILKDIFKKDYVVLDDLAEVPDYYTKLGFEVLGATYKYGLIDTLLASPKCQP
ncbi:MAG TPA: hypothetical protein VEL47_05235, partial [Myxococcota bacterium]|nr:hypothetical protein [Myxococcota bacterium]